MILHMNFKMMTSLTNKDKMDNDLIHNLPYDIMMFLNRCLICLEKFLHNYLNKSDNFYLVT